MDPNVGIIIDKLAERSAAGLKKYGVDTTRTDLSRIDWLIHAQDEALDFAVYLQVLINEEAGSAISEEINEGQTQAEDPEQRAGQGATNP